MTKVFVEQLWLHQVCSTYKPTNLGLTDISPDEENPSSLSVKAGQGEKYRSSKGFPYSLLDRCQPSNLLQTSTDG